MSERPHSEEQFTASRDHWWNADYLDLLQRRHDLRACRRVLELGAGIGHWSAVLMERCAPDAAFTLVDREEAWVGELGRRFAARPNLTIIRADVADLSAVTGPFDLVTCQTLLMHLPDVPALLRQAKRLLVPGGLLLAAEPNNLANRIQATPDSGLTPSEFGYLSALWWAYDAGRTKLGLGREWIAEALPGLIAAAGFQGLTVSQNDRAWPRFPPYDTPDQVAVYGDDDSSAPLKAEERAEIRRFASMGGLDDAAIARGCAAHDRLNQRTSDVLARGVYSSAGAGNMFVFAARSPIPRGDRAETR